MREVDIAASIDGCSRLLYRTLQIGYLVDGGIIAHHHSVEAEIVAQNVLQNLTIGHAVRSMYGMIARHQGITASQTNHRLVREQNLLHQFLLVGITTSTIAEVMLRTGAYAFPQVALL